MLISDLKHTCASCKGSGFIAGFNEVGSLQANPKRRCNPCQGLGYQLTTLGQEVWDVLQPLVQRECERWLQDQKGQDDQD